MADVFICYHERSAGNVAAHIANALEQVGITCWYSLRDIPPGVDFARTIPQQIDSCNIFLLLINKGFAESRHVENEVALAFRRRREGITVLPCLIEDCPMSTWMKYYLARTQILKMTPPDEEHINFLVEQIVRMFGYKNLKIQLNKLASDYEDECKVIFLGEGGTGKSSLIDRILGEGFQEGALPTEGIRIRMWATSVKKKPVRLRILDFGGQEIMHSMHRCFLTLHTVYVVVCASRNDGDVDRQAARWLENVKTFAPDCPVILALNKADKNPHVSVNELKLRETNAMLRTVLATSAKTQQGVPKLVSLIRQEIPSCIHRIVETAEALGVKRELDAMSQDYITAEAYQDICERHRIYDKTKQENLLDWFQNLGTAYSFKPDDNEEQGNRLMDYRVLNPAWLTNGIYRLILRTPDTGFLPYETIWTTMDTPNDKDILPDKTYSRKEVSYILDVMHRFKISAKCGGGSDASSKEIIPMKMPKTPPSGLDYNALKNRSLHLYWTAGYIPNNLIHELIIDKFNELDLNHVWRTGAVFHSGNNNERTALVELDEKRIDVYVTSFHRADNILYMDSFRTEIQRIAKKLHINPEEWICHHVERPEERGGVVLNMAYDGEIKFSMVLAQIRMGLTQVFIEGFDFLVPITDLLQATYVSPQREIDKAGISIDALYVNGSMNIGPNAGASSTMGSILTAGNNITDSGAVSNIEK